MKKLRFTAIILMLAMLLGIATLFTACSSKDKVVGTWTYGSSRTIEISEDHTYIYYHDGAHMGIWQKSGDNYVFTGSQSGASSYGIINDNGELQILDDGGKVDTIGEYTYTRKK